MLTFDDPIAPVVGLLHPRTEVDHGLRAGGEWSVRFGGPAQVRLGVVGKGSCWLSVPGRHPVQLGTLDFFLLGNVPEHVLSSAPGLSPRPAATITREDPDAALRIGPEADEDTYICGGNLVFEGAGTEVLTEALPSLVVVRADDPRGRMLIHLGELMVAEAANTSVGSPLVLNHLAQIMLVYLLRIHVERSDEPAGWLAALSDHGVGAALRAMHTEPAHPWTLTELAATCHLSRSAFASAFKQQVGTSPVDYLIQWRMSLARDALTRGTHTISELAYATGYRSESAFSTAFRRQVGTSPRRFRDAATGRPPQPSRTG